MTLRRYRSLCEQEPTSGEGGESESSIACDIQYGPHRLPGVAPGAPELAAGAHSGMTDREQLLDELRPVSFAIAYRMLGSVSEAEDVVQEALLRVHQALDAGEQIASPRAFDATVTTRLAINELRSARTRRERYVGEWLPEPIITGGHDDPARHAETADSLSLAMLVLLESLSPEQRAVLLLHDVFDYGYPEITAIVGKSEDNVRQLATRARRHVEVNGGPGALLLDGQQRLIGVWALDVAGGQNTSISAIVNPDKLAHLGPVADSRLLLRRQGDETT
jgi:RNA polymerase sigma factor (sigma-70 family)